MGGAIVLSILELGAPNPIQFVAPAQALRMQFSARRPLAVSVGVQRADVGGPVVQINTALKLGVMWDHNGTYMEGFGFQYRDQQIQVTLNTEDRMSGESPAAAVVLHATQPARLCATLCFQGIKGGEHACGSCCLALEPELQNWSAA